MAYALSSVSGNLISAASAGYAPTNSGEVSAIASAYQVVSAMATQLYAGTAYVTSINDAPISAARAGNAANASMANSAYYDGTGRLISALPDSATVSAIASSYAESAASGKQDTLTFGYDTAYKISAINGSALAGEGGGLVTAIGTSESGITSINNSGLVDTAALRSADYSSLYVQEPLYISASGDSSYIGISGNVGGIDSATCSAIASAYAESAASSKQDALTFGYNAADQISSIDGSALGGMDEAAVSAIASAYAESAASSKLDTTAYNSADFYSTSNPSGFIDSAYVDSAVSGKADSSALSSYVPYSSLEYNTASAISGINGSALAAGSTYSAGEGIDITGDVISVEAPVDIVAGPGIVIDNPDGNTLRVSVAQAEEVVLYDAGDSPSQAGPWQISEARTNFEWLDIVFGNDSTGSMKQVTRFAADSEYMKLHLPRYDEEPSYKWATMTLSWNNTTASIKTNSVGRFTIASNGSISVSTVAAQAPYLFQIVGIHRIANN